MDHNSFKTVPAKVNEIDQQWHVVDAENQVVGRLAARVAAILRGKHKPSYTPHLDTGDFVVVVNADKARFTGKKETDKEYFSHCGYPGGVTTTDAEGDAGQEADVHHRERRQGHAAPQPARPRRWPRSSRSTPAPSTRTRPRHPQPLDL